MRKYRHPPARLPKIGMPVVPLGVGRFRGDDPRRGCCRTCRCKKPRRFCLFFWQENNPSSSANRGLPHGLVKYNHLRRAHTKQTGMPPPPRRRQRQQQGRRQSQRQPPRSEPPAKKRSLDKPHAVRRTFLRVATAMAFVLPLTAPCTVLLLALVCASGVANTAAAADTTTAANTTAAGDETTLRGDVQLVPGPQPGPGPGPAGSPPVPSSPTPPQPLVPPGPEPEPPKKRHNKKAMKNASETAKNAAHEVRRRSGRDDVLCFIIRATECRAINPSYKKNRMYTGRKNKRSHTS